MTIKNLYPSVLPSLNLDFANSRVLDPRVSFTRASASTYVGSDGLIKTAATNEPRFDHNPTTGESLGLLVEEQGTNLLQWSEDAIARWPVKGLVTVSANTTGAPNGTFTAESCIETATSGDHYLQTVISQAANTALSYSVFLKPLNSNRSISITMFANSFADSSYAHFNLSTATVLSVNKSGTGALPAASIQQLANGWLRLSISGQPTTAAVTDLNLRVQLINLSSTYTGDGASGIYLWGAQLEAGSFPTSYIPTTSAAATRAADVAQITGTNFSSWYRQDEGSIYISGAPRYIYGGTNTFPRSFSISNNTTMTMIDGRYRVLSPFSDSGYAIADGGVTQATYDSASNTAGQAMCIAYKVNSFAFSTGGALSDSDTSGTVPTVDRIALGSLPNGFSALNGTIKRLTYWPQRLSNSNLQAITQ